jgi:hypothetical protein
MSLIEPNCRVHSTYSLPEFQQSSNHPFQDSKTLFRASGGLPSIMLFTSQKRSSSVSYCLDCMVNAPFVPGRRGDSFLDRIGVIYGGVIEMKHDSSALRLPSVRVAFQRSRFGIQSSRSSTLNPPHGSLNYSLVMQHQLSLCMLLLSPGIFNGWPGLVSAGQEFTIVDRNFSRLVGSSQSWAGIRCDSRRILNPWLEFRCSHLEFSVAGIDSSPLPGDSQSLGELRPMSPGFFSH